MTSVSFTQSQFLIAVGMSEANILSLRYEDNNLYIVADGINMLYDFTELNLYFPDITYDEWLNIKYSQVGSNKFEYIYVDDAVEFVINDPNIYYEGEQDQFLNLFSQLDLNYIDSPKHRYIFGGTYKDSSHDEFEVQSNSPIIINIADFVIKKAANNFHDEERKILKFKSTVNADKERQLRKNKLRKRKNIHDNSFLLLP